MRETVKDWREEWINTNGLTKDLEVVIKDSRLDIFHPCVYEGCFADIPTDLFERRVLESGRIVASSVPERNGAYSLTV